MRRLITKRLGQITLMLLLLLMGFTVLIADHYEPPPDSRSVDASLVAPEDEEVVGNSFDLEGTISIFFEEDGKIDRAFKTDDFEYMQLSITCSIDDPSDDDDDNDDDDNSSDDDDSGDDSDSGSARQIRTGDRYRDDIITVNDLRKEVSLVGETLKKNGVQYGLWELELTAGELNLDEWERPTLFTLSIRYRGVYDDGRFNGSLDTLQLFYDPEK